MMSKIITPDIAWSFIIKSNPIEDLRLWQKEIGDKYGIYGDLISLNNKTFDLVRGSWKTKEFLEGKKRISDIENLLWGSNLLKNYESLFIISEKMEDGLVSVGLKNDSRISLSIAENISFIVARVI
jgi:hypothetical protein